MPDRLRLPGPAGRPGDRAAAEGARADLHRVLLAAHVRVADVLPDAGRADRRVRGGVGVLRRRVQGPDPRQRLGDRRRRGRGEPAVHRGLAGLRPALRVRHRRGPGPVPERQASGRAGRAVRARQLLRRRGLRQPGRRAGPRPRPGAATRPGCGSTAPSRPARPRYSPSSEAAALLPLPRPYDVPVFTGVKVHRDFHVEVGRPLYSAPKEYLGSHLDARADSALVKLYHRGAAGQDPPAGRSRAGGSPTPLTCPSTRPPTRCATWRRWPPRPAGTATRSASTPSGCWTPTCRGRRCGRSTGCSAWSAATAPARSTPPAPAGAGPRCRQRHQDRLDAGESHREHPARRRPARPRDRPVRPRPGRVPARCS